MTEKLIIVLLVTLNILSIIILGFVLFSHGAREAQIKEGLASYFEVTYDEVITIEHEEN